MTIHARTGTISRGLRESKIYSGSPKPCLIAQNCRKAYKNTKKANENTHGWRKENTGYRDETQAYNLTKEKRVANKKITERVFISSGRPERPMILDFKMV